MDLLKSKCTFKFFYKEFNGVKSNSNFFNFIIKILWYFIFGFSSMIKKNVDYVKLPYCLIILN